VKKDQKRVQCFFRLENTISIKICLNLLPSRYFVIKEIPPPLPVSYFRMALFIEGHIAFKGNRAQVPALIGSEMFWEE